MQTRITPNTDSLSAVGNVGCNMVHLIVTKSPVTSVIQYIFQFVTKS